MLRSEDHLRIEARQKKSGRRLLLAGVLAACWLPAMAQSSDGLDAGGLNFRDFGVSDNGASFGRSAGTIAGGHSSSMLVGVDSKTGAARIRFDSVKAELSVPMGWQASEDWERGVAHSTDKHYRVLLWRVDFAYEEVKDAEHYAATKAGTIKARRPSVQAQARKLGDGTFLIVYENVPKGQGDTEPRTVFDLVIPNPKNPKLGVLLTLGVPSSDSTRGLKLMALLKQNLRIDW
jgi:hypothetical protein